VSELYTPVRSRSFWTQRAAVLVQVVTVSFATFLLPAVFLQGYLAHDQHSATVGSYMGGVICYEQGTHVRVKSAGQTELPALTVWGPVHSNRPTVMLNLLPDRDKGVPC